MGKSRFMRKPVYAGSEKITYTPLTNAGNRHTIIKNENR